MPESSPSSTARINWRLADASILASEADLGLRQTLLLTNAAGFLSGYYAMHNQWVQVVWVGLWTAAWFWEGGFQEFLESLRQDRWFAAVAGMMLLMLARSSLLESPGLTMQMLWRGWLGVGLLSVVLMTLWSVGRQPRALVWLGVPMVGVAALAALALRALGGGGQGKSGEQSTG